jgi:hypothetical protein
MRQIQYRDIETVVKLLTSTEWSVLDYMGFSL